MDFALVVVKIQGDAAVFLARPIFVDHVVLLEDTDEVVGVFFAHVFDPEIINNGAETYWSPGVRPKSRCLVALVIAMFG